MTFSNSFVILFFILIVVILAYVVRSLRIHGTKLSEIQRDVGKISRELDSQLGGLNAAVQSPVITELPGIRKGKKSWKYILSFTSHPARFETLPEFLPSILNQLLAPEEIHLNIASSDLPKLSKRVRAALIDSGVEIFSTPDWGPAKKLIPTLKRTKLPVICIDDDLVFNAELTLQLMTQHQLFPDSVIASRTHRITLDEQGQIKAFKEWEGEYWRTLGPDPRLFATSGAGTLVTVQHFHRDLFDEELYRELAFHTDDLWWYFQARRIGVDVRRVPGKRPLEFIPGTQESGLWSNGNKERNDINVKKLVAKYGRPF